MKILVSLHDLVLGGTTVNCIELAAALRNFHGHEVVLFASPGPLTDLVVDAGLRFVPAPTTRFHPSPFRMRALRALVRQERPDLLHVWQTWPCLDAFYAVHLPLGIPMVVTDMQMHVTRILPKGLMTTFGTPELVDRAKAGGRRKVELLLPPVDMSRNSRAVVDPTRFREACGVKPGDITLVTVSRLAESMKGEGLFSTLQAIRALGRSLPIRLIIVGDGTARAAIAQAAADINSELGRNAVVLAGALLDPRPAYAAADIVVGMGSSALRAMAFGKPTIVVGEKGFSASFTPQSASEFLYKGLYGVGAGDRTDLALTENVRGLAEDPGQLPALGEFSRDFVSRHFSLDVVASRLSEICKQVADDRPEYWPAVKDALRTSAVYFRERRFLWRAPPASQLKGADTTVQAGQ